jgi:hypothetical protein
MEKLELIKVNSDEVIEGSFYLCGKVYAEDGIYLIDWVCLEYKDGFLTDFNKPYYDPEKFDYLYKLPAKNL